MTWPVADAIVALVFFSTVAEHMYAIVTLVMI
jgi:hypothetical protein